LPTPVKWSYQGRGSAAKVGRDGGGWVGDEGSRDDRWGWVLHRRGFEYGANLRRSLKRINNV